MLQFLQTWVSLVDICTCSFQCLFVKLCNTVNMNCLNCPSYQHFCFFGSNRSSRSQDVVGACISAFVHDIPKLRVPEASHKGCFKGAIKREFKRQLQARKPKTANKQAITPDVRGHLGRSHALQGLVFSCSSNIFTLMRLKRKASLF